MGNIEPIKVAVVGLGNIGWGTHCAILSQLNGFELYGAFDLSRQRVEMASSKYKVKRFDSFSDVIRDKKVELLVISTTTESHKDLAMQAIKAGKNVVVDKPICLDLKGTEELIEMSQKQKMFLSVFHNRRWDRDFVTLREQVRKGAIGQLLIVETSFMDNGYYSGVKEFDPQWRLKKKFGGGQLMDWGPHLVDHLLRIVEDEVTDVFCIKESRIWSKEVDDYFKIIIRFRNGTIGQAQANQFAKLALPRWFVLGSEGSIRSKVLPAEMKGCLTPIVPCSSDEEMQLEIVNGKEGEKKYIVPEMIDTNWKCYYEDVYNAVREGKQPEVTLKQIWEIMKVIELAKVSDRQRKWVTFR